MRVVERVQRSDVTPVAVVALRRPGHLVVVEVVHRRHTVGHQPRDDVAAHVVVGVVVLGVGADRVDQDLGGEDVVAHRHERLLRVVGRAGRIGRLLDEPADASRIVGVDAPERAGFGARHTDTRHGRPGAALDVLLHHLLRIHPVHVVGAEDHDVVGVLVVDEVHRLVDRIGGAGVPPRTETLLRRHRGDVLTGKPRKPPVLRDVAIQRMRLVLGENTDPQVPSIHEIREHEVDQPVGASEWNRGLGPVSCQRVQPFTFSAGEDDAQHVWRFPHETNLSAGGDGGQLLTGIGAFFRPHHVNCVRTCQSRQLRMRRERSVDLGTVSPCGRRCEWR